MVGLITLLAIAPALLTALLTAILVRDMVRPPRHTAAYAVAKGLAVDPGELGLSFESWMLERPGGVSLAVWEISNLRSQISDLKSQISWTAIFLHGWGHGRIDWLARIKPFLPLFDRLVLYDLRGHGDSTGLSRLGHGEDDDLLALIERLGSQGQADRIVLIGHSMGAVIALKAASRVAGLGGVIAYGPYCEFHDSLRGRLRVAGYPGRPVTDLALAVHRVAGLRPVDLRQSDVASLRCPVLIIHGRDDAISPLGHSERLAAASTNVILQTIEAAGHRDAHQVDEASHEEIVRGFVIRIQARAPERVVAGCHGLGR